MKIVVIGGTGLIGSKLVKKLKDIGHEAVAASPSRVLIPSQAKAFQKLLFSKNFILKKSKKNYCHSLFLNIYLERKNE